MKFSFVTVLFTSVVLTQKVKILLGNDEYSIVGGNGFGCYRSDNRAFGIRAPRNVEVRLFKNGDCGGDSYLRTWGRAWFRRPFEYCSVELVRRGSGGSYDDCDDNDDGDSGPDGDDEEKYHENGIRNEYFKNRSCLANVIEFLKQEVVIMRGDYFSYIGGSAHLIDYGYFSIYDIDDLRRYYSVFANIEVEGGYHICRLDDYITIVDGWMRCIFTNKNMVDGDITGTIVWVKNFGELLKRFDNGNLKRISNAIVQPFVPKRFDLNETANEQLVNESNIEKFLDLDFFTSMEIYKPEIIYEYTIDSYKENDCLDVYNRLKSKDLSSLVDKYIPSYRWCKGDITEDEGEAKSDLCKCGGLKALCYLDL